MIDRDKVYVISVIVILITFNILRHCGACGQVA